MRRIVVTGVGAISSLGFNAEDVWRNVVAGRCAFKRIENFDVSSAASKIGAQLDISSLPVDEKGQILGLLPVKDANRMDSFVVAGVIAGINSVEDSGIHVSPSVDPSRVGVFIGSGIGGISQIGENALSVKGVMKKRVGPFFIPSVLVNIVNAHVGIRYGFGGCAESTVSACSSGAHSIISAIRAIRSGEIDAAVAGGAECGLCDIGLAGFNAMKALSSHFNDEPTKASRPWDKRRDGFVMAEGSGVVVIETYESAKARGANIYAEISGYGSTSDAYHITAPDPEGKGAARAIKNALEMAKIRPSDVGYINAHSTSTQLGDAAELKAITSVFGDELGGIPVSSTKSTTGHLLGAAGSIEAIFSILAMRDGILPPTINLDEPDTEYKNIDFVPNIAREKKIDVAVSNSFGFGGPNAVLVFSKV